MPNVNTALIERYQMMFQKNPQSRIFATLGDAYRRMGLLQEAKAVCTEGLRHHPHFAGGLVAMARVLIEESNFTEAQIHLSKAVKVDPENLMAQSQLADCWLRLKEPKKALTAYKMVLYLNPKDAKAQKVVAKLESLTADEFTDEMFSMKPLQQVVQERDELNVEVIHPEAQPQKTPGVNTQQILERFLSLADAFVVRNDLTRARESLDEAVQQLGPHPEIQKRVQIIEMRQADAAPPARAQDEIPIPQSPPKPLYQGQKIEYLKSLLERVKTRRREM